MGNREPAHKPPGSLKTSTLAVSPWQGLAASTRAGMELTHTCRGLGGVGRRLQRGWEPGRRDAEIQVRDAGLGQGWKEARGSHQINFTKTWALAAEGPPEMSGADGIVISQTGTVTPREGQGSPLVSLQVGPTAAPRTQAPGPRCRTVSAPGACRGVRERARAEPQHRGGRTGAPGGPEARGGGHSCQ